MAPVLRHCPCLRPENDDVRLLDYSHSNLDDVPNEVFGFERTLEELFLDANQIKDLPRPLFHCHGLRKLNLSDNEIQTLPPAVASLINLEQLDISKNGILEIPDNIKGCKCLTVIDASVNPLGKLPEGFTFLINLQELYLNDTFLEYLPANFGRLSRLKILELRENHLKLLPKSMARLTELCRLDIGQNDFSDLPEVIGNLPRLVELWCDNNNLSCLPPFLGGLKKLAYLDASKNKIYEIADEIEGCISLCDLTLSSNRIKVLPDGIANLRKLSVLRVDENRITTVPENIGNLCILEELVMSSNNLKSLPLSIGLLRNLQTLIADDNLLEELPCEMGSCLKLTILSLRDNKLVQIPDELGHINALKVINLSGNLLQYLPFSIAKLPNLQALWLSENQNKPLIPLQSDTDRATGQKVLTCFMLPQVPFDEEVIEVEEVEVSDSGKGRQIIKFAFDADKDQPSKLVRAPTPYPKELKAHARHARNYALKKQGSKESDTTDVPNDISQVPNNVEGLNAIGATPDIMILPREPAPEPDPKVKEAVVTKPKSPLASPLRHERHYIQNVKDPVSNEILEIKQHTFLEKNPLQLSHQSSTEVPAPDIAPKVLGRRDSRGDGSSSENTSTSATGSPKSTPDVAMAEGYNNPHKVDKDCHFRKNIPGTAGKRDTWMRQRLLRQGSGDSDRGYRSDHEVYLAEKDQYGQGYHDGYASDWEAFLAKQNYSAPPNEAMQNPQYMRTMPQGDVGYRGHAEGQEIKDGERDGYPYQWDPRFRYPDDASMVDDEYQARMTPPYDGYWQMDPNTGQFYGAYDMSHSYPPSTDNPAYVYARNQHGDVPPMPAQPYYDEDGYKHPPSHIWVQRMPNPGAVVVNNPGTLPRRLGAASPRMKRSQCLSVQAPLHGSPQEYHLIPHQAPNLHPPIPNSSPRPGRSPSPGIDNRVQYSPQPYPKFAPHYQPQYTAQGYPITAQPVNTVHFPPPMPNVHPSYRGNFPEAPPPPMYPTMPTSPRMKQPAQPYVMSTVDDSALLSRGYSHIIPQPGVHSSGYYNPENIPPGQHIDSYSHSLQNPLNPDAFTKVQDAEYGLMHSATLQYRTGSIPAHIQNIENCDMDIQHLNRSVPSINIIPSTSPPHTAYIAAAAGDWRDKPKQGNVSVGCSEVKSENVAVSSHDNSRTNNIVSNSSTTEDNKVCSSVSPNAEHDESHTHISSQDSFVVVSPKPSKLLNPHMISNSPVNKDMGTPSISNNNQTAFRKPGCFQAVPVTIPGVHSSARKKEIVQNQQKSYYSNDDDDVINHSNNVQSSPNVSEQKNESHLETKVLQPPIESSKQSGIVGKMVSQINNSSEVDKNNPHPDTKTLPAHHLQDMPIQNTKNESEKLDYNSSSAKPGFPVKVASNQSSNPSQLAKDVPPDLPKKEKRNQLNTSFSSESKRPMHQIQNLSKDPKKMSSEKSSNSVPLAASKDQLKHPPSVPEHSKVLHSKIALENSKNTKIENNNPHYSNSRHSKPDVLKKTDHESNKVCSTDKRFQKVLPPLDKSFSLKPASPRKSNPSDHSSGVSDSQNVHKSDRIAESIPPSIPPKVNAHQTNAHHPERNSNEPPKIPPKKSNLSSKNLHQSHTSKENVLNRDNTAKLPSENHSQIKTSHVNEESLSKLNVDIVEVKDSNNEKNVQLQKGNMPDLISKIIPHEKNELILKEENKIENNKKEKDDPNNKNSLANKEKTNHENNVPESPKSPKRQSWFFGTHKNSLVFPVVILKNPELGFSIEGGIGSPRNPAKPYDIGIYVAHVLADGPASSLLKPGDKILQVDGNDFTHLDHNKALAVLQQSGSTVSLMISR